MKNPIKPSTTQLDSLKGAGWTTFLPTKPTELTKLEAELNDLSVELEKESEKLKSKKERNKNDSSAINTCNEKIKKKKDLIKSWHCDSKKIEQLTYYDTAWKKQ